MSYALSCLNILSEPTYATLNKATGYTPQLATSTPIYPAQYLQYPPPQPQNVPNHVPMLFKGPFQTQQSPPLLPHQQPNDVSRLLTEVLSRLNGLDQKLGRLDEIDKKSLKLDTVSTNLGKLNSQVQNLEGNLAAVNKLLGDVEKSSVVVSGKLDDITKENKNIVSVSKSQNKILHERIASLEKQNIVFKGKISKIANETKSKSDNDSLDCLNVMKTDNERLRSSVLDLQCQLNENLVFNGIAEQTDEVTDDLVKAFVRTELEIVREIPIVKSYRIGKHFDGKARPIVVKFKNRNDRQDIRFAAQKHLKGKSF
ncbi:unnamed protein product [Mytilus coruscus]|uniref:Uncharacterized protein n=1 Tax=Mytilus coruscus TaxID=42192 RepID=A0A6J7ZZ91_MYTCO|nr:unnamed protein product [Mytilus coruscus]